MLHPALRPSRFAPFAFAVLAVATAALAGHPPKAQGSGVLDLVGGLRTFSFTARVMPDGTVQGMGNIQNRSQGNHVKFTIDCLLVETATIATMSGRVTSTTDPAFENNLIWFRAFDVGEGAADPRDRMTLVGLFPGAAPDCTGESAFVLGTLAEIGGGNIQVDAGD
jgi:hypothetical protein